MVNLNNGGVSAPPRPTCSTQMIRDLRFSNELPVQHMWPVLEPRIESVRRDLARDFGCDPEEMAITRNASESQRDHDPRPRPQARGRGARHQPELRPDAHQLGAAGTARRDRAQADLASRCRRPRSSTWSISSAPRSRPRTRVIEVTHITNLTGPDHAGEGDRGDGAAAGHRGVRRRRARLRALPLQARRTWGATTTAPACTSGCWRRSAPDSSMCGGRSSKGLWPMMAAPPEMDDEHPEVRGDRHPPGGQPQRDRGGARLPSRHRRRAEDRAASLPPGSLGQAAAGRERPGEGAHAARFTLRAAPSGSSRSTASTPASSAPGSWTSTGS